MGRRRPRPNTTVLIAAQAELKTLKSTYSSRFPIDVASRLSRFPRWQEWVLAVSKRWGVNSCRDMAESSAWMRAETITMIHEEGGTARRPRVLTDERG
jgi:hypothetical protein